MDCNDITSMKGSAMEPIDPKLKTLAALHELDSDAGRMIDAIDRKLEGVTDETVQVNVGALKTIRMIMFGQRYALQQLVEHTAEMDDEIEKATAMLQAYLKKD